MNTLKMNIILQCYTVLLRLLQYLDDNELIHQQIGSDMMSFPCSSRVSHVTFPARVIGKKGYE